MKFARKFLKLRTQYVSEFYGITLAEDTPQTTTVEKCIRQAIDGGKFSVHIISRVVTFKDQEDRRNYANGLRSYLQTLREDYDGFSFLFDPTAYHRAHVMRMEGQSKAKQPAARMVKIWGDKIPFQLTADDTDTIFEEITKHTQQDEADAANIPAERWYSEKNRAH